MTTVSLPTSLLILYCFLLFHVEQAHGYQIYHVEDPRVCNSTIWLDQGPNSAALLYLTAQPSYNTSTSLVCTVTFKAPVHTWSGLVGVLEAVDLRRYQDFQHHLAQSVCIDYVTITSPVRGSVQEETHNGNPYRQEQCGTWSINPQQPLSSLGHRRALVGHCTYNSPQCDPLRELEVLVVIGRPHERDNLWKNRPSTRHRGFTFVVTAYSFAYGVNECAYELRSCGGTVSEGGGGTKGPPTYCVHDTLWCDGHVNCGHQHSHLRSMDERSCHDGDVWNGLLTVVAGPWVGAGLLLLLLVWGVLCHHRFRPRAVIAVPQSQLAAATHANTQEFNSYAESYEVSSNLSSAHHMAIQVRVVCNSAGQHLMASGSSGRCAGTTAGVWKPDMPPSYETLFPHGPPAEVSNVPPQTHSPQFAHATAAITLGSTHSVTDTTNVVNMVTFNSERPHTSNTLQCRQITRTTSSLNAQSQAAFGETCVGYHSNNSLDRRVPIRRDCIGSSSVLNNGVLINTALINASRLTLTSDPPGSPPSYESDHHTVESPRGNQITNRDLQRALPFHNYPLSPENDATSPQTNASTSNQDRQQSSTNESN